MRISLIFLLISIFSLSLNGQISKHDQQKISKIIGEDFIFLPTQKEYPYSPFEKRFKVDMSTVLLGDTVGVSYNNEQLLWHDFITFSEKEEVLKMAKPSYVTVGEYLAFQNWVRDSIARDYIYLTNSGKTSCMDFGISDEDSKEWINWDIEPNVGSNEIGEIDFYNRKVLRSIYTLNWNKKIDYNDPQIMKIVLDLYYPVSRIWEYKFKQIDERKLMYKYFNQFKNTPTNLTKIDFTTTQKSKKNIIIDQLTATLTNPFSWLNYSNYARDEYSVLAQTFIKLQLNSSMFGINNPQEKAYCHWKQENLQKEIDKQKLPYKIVLSMPTISDIESLKSTNSKFTIPIKDYTSQWQITNAEYAIYMEKVKDSILRHFLYFNKKLTNNEADQYFKFTPIYFDDGAREYAPYDPNDRELGKSIFPLNYSSEIKKFSDSAEKTIDSFKLSRDYMFPKFMYYYIDSRNKYPELYTDSLYDTIYKNYWSDKTSLEYNKFGYDVGFSVDKIELNWTNTLNQTTNVKPHHNFQIFTVLTQINSEDLSNKDNSNPKALTQGLTYEQALAFYYWKYPIHNPKPTDDWQNFVLPSKQQFEDIQKGKQIIVPEKKVEFPTPLFRYVVHVYPK